MEVQVECANITNEERKKILNRAARIAGMMVKEIREKTEEKDNGIQRKTTTTYDSNN